MFVRSNYLPCFVFLDTLFQMVRECTIVMDTKFPTKVEIRKTESLCRWAATLVKKADSITPRIWLISLAVAEDCERERIGKSARD